MREGIDGFKFVKIIDQIKTIGKMNKEFMGAIACILVKRAGIWQINYCLN
jgi:hypothetical protein